MFFFDFFRYGFFIFFVVLHIANLIGFFIEWRRDKKTVKQHTDNAKVSVIIPIHNESKRMDGLLRSLLVQKYNAEVIFIDDRSSDESPVILEKFCCDAAQSGFLSCRIITLTENPGINKKQYALSRGIKEATGDYFLLTDGDCEVAPDWIMKMTQRINDGKTGAVIGQVFKENQKGNFHILYQCYDLVFRLNYIIGTAGLGIPGCCFGGNLIISREALDNSGGYDSIPPTLTEDAALISHLSRKGGYKIRAIVLPDAIVKTKPEETWRDFFNQFLRWNNGGLFSPDKSIRLNYNILMICLSTGVLAVFLLPFISGLWLLPAAVFIAMMLNSLVIIGFFHKTLSHDKPYKIHNYLIFLFLTPVFLTVLNLIGYIGFKPKWKNVEL